MLLVIGGQAPKAIRSVECFDFTEEKWSQVADMPTRRCRCGMYAPVIASVIATVNNSIQRLYVFVFLGVCFLFSNLEF